MVVIALLSLKAWERALATKLRSSKRRPREKREIDLVIKPSPPPSPSAVQPRKEKAISSNLSKTYIINSSQMRQTSKFLSHKSYRFTLITISWRGKRFRYTMKNTLRSMMCIKRIPKSSAKVSLITLCQHLRMLF